MASAATFVPVEVYLTTSYQPDCEYIDGQVLERNAGETPHSSVQKFFIGAFLANEKKWDVRVFPEDRVQVAEERYRVPDLCVVRRSTPLENIIVTPPLICIEVLSPEDRMSRTQESVDDYIRMGVQSVWVVDPRRRKVYVADRSTTLQEVGDFLTLDGTQIRVAVSEIFGEIEEMEALG
jgi:Uma2 family endonuclease